MGLLNINHRQVPISGRNDNPRVKKKGDDDTTLINK